MDTQQIDVMVADASHEVYVDTILETIRNAAKVRGTGIAEFGLEVIYNLGGGSNFLGESKKRNLD